MRLTRLELAHFQAYTQLDLPLGDVELLVIVGDNGAGKSALRDAITWALYGISRASVEDRLIQHGSETCSVRVTFLDENVGEVVVERSRTRGRSGSLSLTVGGEVRTGHTIADTEGSIVSLVGLTGHGLLAGPFMEGAGEGSFMAEKPADRKDLIHELGGLDRFIPAWKEASSEATGAKREIEVLGEQRARWQETIDKLTPQDPEAQLERVQTALALHTESLSLAEARIAAVAGPLAAAQERVKRHSDLEGVQQRVNERLTRAIAEQGTLEGLIAHLRSEMAADPPVPAAASPDPEEMLARLGRLRIAVAEAQANAKQVGPAFARVRETEEALDRAYRLRDRAASAPCGAEDGPYATTCVFLTNAPTAEVTRLEGILATSRTTAAEMSESAGTEPTFAAELTALEASAAAAERQRQRQVREADAFAANRASLEGRLSDAETNLVSRSEAVAALRADLERATTEIRTIEAAFGEITALEQEEQDARRVAHSARAQILPLEEALVEVRRRLDLLVAARAGVEGLNPRIAAAEGDFATWTILSKALHRDGVPTMMLAAMLPLIEDRANEVLRRLPGNFSLTFTTSSRGWLDIEVDIDGETMEYEMLSTGQRLRVDIALRLGLATMLASRHGAAIRTLWLDEPLAPLSANGKAAFIDMLTALADDFGLVVVVSHDPDFNDRFGSVLEVSMEAGVSSARLIA